jgi:hypothetical protein
LAARRLLSLVIAKVIDPKTRKELTRWYLMSNVFDVSSATIALWYYYRWRIESYFNLLKSGGQEIEHWQQESGLAILKRLLSGLFVFLIILDFLDSINYDLTQIDNLRTRLANFAEIFL